MKITIERRAFSPTAYILRAVAYSVVAFGLAHFLFPYWDISKGYPAGFQKALYSAILLGGYAVAWLIEEIISFIRYRIGNRKASQNPDGFSK
jgi:hypothetical protein